jgi:hypothetical protein
LEYKYMYAGLPDVEVDSAYSPTAEDPAIFVVDDHAKSSSIKIEETEGFPNIRTAVPAGEPSSPTLSASFSTAETLCSASCEATPFPTTPVECNTPVYMCDDCEIVFAKRHELK